MEATHKVAHCYETLDLYENMGGQQEARRRFFRFLFVFLQYIAARYDRLA
jgi:hypothetical protein